MWDYYDLTLHVERLAGGIPRSPQLVKRWQEAVGGKPEDAARIIEELGEQALDEKDAVKAIWTGFLSDEHGLYIEGRQVKAMLKESANIVKAAFPATNRSGKKTIPPLKARLAETVFVKPNRLYLGRQQADAFIERPIHVMTAQGPRTALKRTDYVDDVKIDCFLKVLSESIVTERHLRGILDHAAENGLGTDRSQGLGTFEYQLERHPDKPGGA